MIAKRMRLYAVAACSLIAFGVAVAPSAAQAPNGGSADWTFAIYMCSDNDLDYWGELNTDWLKEVGSTADVKFVVLWDTSEGPADLYLIEKKKMVKMTDYEHSGEEVNMGDPEILSSFMDYLAAEFPSDDLALVLWDHGDDFRGICFDYDTGTKDKMDYLSHQEITSALKGRPLSVLAADGCGLGVIEVAYEYAMNGVTAEWFVANENYVPLEGFPYDMIAADLVANPSMTPEELSKDMVARYPELYQKGWLTELAAIKLTEIPRVVSELWDVTDILMDDMLSYKGLVSSGRGQATMGWSQYGWEGYVDFPTIFEVIYSKAAPGSDLEVQTGELLSAIEAAVPYVGASQPADVWDPEGLSVFFPSADGSYKHNTWWRGSLYPTMQFAQEGWLDFLFCYWNSN
ncbi:MAG: hypothetical protein JW880_02735 [Candidatus Thermoplasmatota archaeon]|nr:hypothetical protein [Candidatus Thermoplasmatota archaeon]